MARLIVRAVDSPGKLDMKRGHVVEILADGQSPGTKIVGNPRYRIIDVPGATVAEMWHLKQREEVPPDSLKEVPARLHKLAIDTLETAEAGKKGRVLAAADVVATNKAAILAVVTSEVAKDPGVVLPPEEEKL